MMERHLHLLFLNKSSELDSQLYGITSQEVGEEYELPSLLCNGCAKVVTDSFGRAGDKREWVRPK